MTDLDSLLETLTGQWRVCQVFQDTKGLWTASLDKRGIDPEASDTFRQPNPSFGFSGARPHPTLFEALSAALADGEARESAPKSPPPSTYFNPNDFFSDLLS